MARDFTKVSPAIWASKCFKALQTDDERYCFLYLITNPHLNSAGAYRLPHAYAAHDLGWSIERYERAVVGLQEAGMILTDAECEELYISNWFRHNPPMNPSHRIGIIGHIERLTSAELRAVALKELEADFPKKLEEPSAAAGKTIGSYAGSLPDIRSRQQSVPVTSTGPMKSLNDVNRGVLQRRS